MVLDGSVNIGDVERHGQAPRERIKIAQVDLALASHFKLPLETSRELAHRDRHENKQRQIEDFLRVSDPKTVERRIEEERRREHAADSGDDCRHNSPAGRRNHDRDEEKHRAVGEADFPDQREQHGGQNRNKAERPDDAW